MFINIRRQLEVHYMNELFEAQSQICLAIPGRHEMKREIEIRPDFSRPWLVFYEPRATQKAGFSEKELRLLHTMWQIDLEDTPQDQLEFILGFNNAMDRWASFEVINRPLPPFTTRQFNAIAHQLEQRVEDITSKKDLTLRFFLETCADPVKYLTEITPLQQYQALAALRLDNEIPPHSEAEIRILLGMENAPATTKV